MQIAEAGMRRLRHRQALKSPCDLDARIEPLALAVGVGAADS